MLAGQVTTRDLRKLRRPLLGRVFYGPPDWLVTKFNSRDRRAFGFWTLLLALSAAVDNPSGAVEIW